jgi:ectoine hydroxylase-related dioxygenase (phytanoyl-CoA dioxygenase family)
MPTPLERHPWNRSFEWRDHDGPFRRVTPAQAHQYDEQGFFVLEGAFDADTIVALVAAIDPLEAGLETVLREKLGGRAFIARAGEITFTPHLVTRSEVARTFTRSPVFADLAHDLLGSDVRLYWDQAVYKKPGTDSPFPWHQDNGYTFIEPQQYLTCWVALTDADEENGCPWVLPGRHRLGTLAHEMTDLGWRCAEGRPDDAVAAPVRAGGIVVFSSLTPHATGPNRSDRVRKSYIVQLAPDGARIADPDVPPEAWPTCDAPDRQYPILVGGRPVA